MRKGGEHAKATECMRRAVDLDPSNVAWRVGLAESLAGAGDKDAARLVVSRVAEALGDRPVADKSLLGRLNAVRAGLY